MRKIVRYGMQVVVVMAICLSLVALNTQPVYANEDAEKEAAIERAHEAIEALPDFPDITAEHRPQVEEARRLVDAAYEAGATRQDMCLKGVLLEMMEEKLDKFVDEEEEDAALPALPATGGFATSLLIGLMLTGSGVLLARHSRNHQ